MAPYVAQRLQRAGHDVVGMDVRAVEGAGYPSSSATRWTPPS
ncbi:MAG: hypothetical protein U0531_10565 [Dehalococcoidia bacterium]